ncbi:MAG: cytochrome c biogenesis protein CcsA [Planctomycetota bacterium]|jgi:ABC-type transport system involved in cytochrome c biogenesis permease subunit
MEIKFTVQGLLIYLTMAAYLSAFVTTISRRAKAGHILFLAGFALSLVSYGYRWVHVGHAPLQNLFEVFLSLGMLCYPISWFCRRALRIGGQWADMLIGTFVLIPAGFVFNAEPQQLPPALQSWLFVPHVAVYMFSYVFMGKAFFLACEHLIVTPSAERTWLPPEQATYRVICVGFPLLTLGLILGSYWGKKAWGDYWAWDPKELWSLVSWLVYLAYFHFRYMFGKRHARMNSLLAILGMVAIIITVTWVTLSTLFPGLHSYAT